MLYKVTNLLSTSVTVEDLGIILPAHGTCTVRAESWTQSRDARELEEKRWIRGDKQFVGGRAPMPVLPERPAPVVARQVPTNPPISQSQIDTPPVQTPVASQESINRLIRNQEELMKMMTGLAGAVPAHIESVHKTIRDMPAPAVVPYRPGSIQPSDYSPAIARGDGPMFLPSKIVPDEVSGNVKVQEGEVDADVGGSVDALRKMRGKKTVG